MDATKIRLSAKEAELVLNAGWILTKNEILKKAKLLLEDVLHEQQTIIGSQKHLLPGEVLAPPAKISKGENYKGLPYLVLDHPRHFDKENVFAIRTLFWWGNFFTVTLHLSGQYKKRYEQQVAAAYQLLKKENIYCCINDDQWEHHLETNNYLLVEELGDNEFIKIITERPFIKLSKKIALSEWDDAPVKLVNDFGLFIKVLLG